MSEGLMEDRKKALEDSFFAKENARLLERMREDREKRVAMQGLAEISGIDDEVLLEKLVSIQITPYTWAALALVPLVEVAWADGQVPDKVRKAVVAAAEASGIAPGSPSAELIDTWLAERPEAALLESWGAYIVDVCANLSSAERTRLSKEIVGRARAIAEATGGLLGFGNRVGPEEKFVLAELEKAFER